MGAHHHHREDPRSLIAVRASNLLDAVVYTSDGARVGRVFELEAARTGPHASEAWGAALQLTRVLIGNRTFFLRLGFQRSGARAPTGMRFLTSKMRGWAARWDQIERVEAGRVHLNCGVGELEELSPKH
jgi:hypothetical protein